MPQATCIQRLDHPDIVWAKYRASTCPVERRRLQTVALVLENRSRREVMGITRYAHSSIAAIIERYNAEGLPGLRDLRHQNDGRPRTLTDEQRLEVQVEIQRRIDEGVLWNGLELTNFLRDCYGIEVRNGSVYRLFSELGFSFQKPRPSHARSDPEAQEAFKTKF